MTEVEVEEVGSGCGGVGWLRRRSLVEVVEVLVVGVVGGGWENRRDVRLTKLSRALISVSLPCHDL